MYLSIAKAHFSLKKRIYFDEFDQENYLVSLKSKKQSYFSLFETLQWFPFDLRNKFQLSRKSLAS